MFVEEDEDIVFYKNAQGQAARVVDAVALAPKAKQDVSDMHLGDVKQ